MNSQQQQSDQIVYQADPQLIESMAKKRDGVLKAVSPLINRHVRVQTINGQIYEGTIVHLDGSHIYLQMVDPNAYQRQFYNPLIMTLVLYELLVITLLSI